MNGVVPCARCGGAMVPTPLGSALAHGCTTCAAVMLTHEHASRVRRGLDRPAVGMAEHAAANRPFVQQATDTVALRCPFCGVVMQPERVSNGVRLDHCPAHGVFFDAHELLQVVPRDMWAVRGGGNGGRPSFGDAMVEFIGQVFFN